MYVFHMLIWGGAPKLKPIIVENTEHSERPTPRPPAGDNGDGPPGKKMCVRLNSG